MRVGFSSDRSLLQHHLTPPCSRPQAEFLLGKRFYSDDSFEKAAQHFEVAVREFFTSNQECRVLCEGAYNYDGYNYMEYSADLFQTITGRTGAGGGGVSGGSGGAVGDLLGLL